MGNWGIFALEELGWGKGEKANKGSYAIDSENKGLNSWIWEEEAKGKRKY